MDQHRQPAADTSPGRSVRLFLADRSPHGLVLAEVGNWTGKVLAVPRSGLSQLLRRPEAPRTEVYIVVGPDPARRVI